MRAYGALDLEHLGPARVAEEIVAADGDGAVVLPLVGRADLARVEGLELGQRLLLGRRRHPGQARDVLAQGGGEGLDHLVHARLALGAESLLDVDAAEGVAQVAVGELHAALPARLDFLRAAQVLPVEAEVLLDEGRAQIGRGPAGDVPAQVGLPVRESACSWTTALPSWKKGRLRRLSRVNGDAPVAAK